MTPYPELWHWMVRGDNTHVYIEHPRTGGEVIEPIRTGRYLFQFGKHKGMRMSDLYNMSYLKFLQETMHKDWFLMRVVEQRVRELQQST